MAAVSCVWCDGANVPGAGRAWHPLAERLRRLAADRQFFRCPVEIQAVRTSLNRQRMMPCDKVRRDSMQYLLMIYADENAVASASAEETSKMAANLGLPPGMDLPGVPGLT